MDFDVPVLHPKFNRYSFYVIKRCRGRLLDHQSEVLEKLQDWFQNPTRKIALVSMPTGSGKTGVICCLPYYLGSIGLEDVPRSFPIGEPLYPFNKPVLVIAPGLEIAEQLQGQILDELWHNFLLKRNIIPRDSPSQRDALSQGKNIDNPAEFTNPGLLMGHDVIIANVQKFPKKPLLEGSQWWGEELPEDFFRLVIVDEAHHFPAPSWQRIINRFQDHAMVVFFTATPYRSDKKKVIDGPLAYHLPLAEARKRRIIRRTKLVVVEERNISEELSEFEQICLPILVKVKEIQETKNRDQPLPGNVPHMAIAIAKDTTNAELAADLWNKHLGLGDGSAFAYHSKVRPEQKEMMMKRVKNDEVRLVVVVEMLKEGFDHPPISIAAILTKIDSPVKFVQFVGRSQRVVRGPECQENSYIHAHFVTHSRYQQGENYRKFENEELIEL